MLQRKGSRLINNAPRNGEQTATPIVVETVRGDDNEQDETDQEDVDHSPMGGPSLNEIPEVTQHDKDDVPYSEETSGKP